MPMQQDTEKSNVARPEPPRAVDAKVSVRITKAHQEQISKLIEKHEDTFIDILLKKASEPDKRSELGKQHKAALVDFERTLDIRGSFQITVNSNTPIGDYHFSLIDRQGGYVEVLGRNNPRFEPKIKKDVPFAQRIYEARRNAAFVALGIDPRQETGIDLTRFSIAEKINGKDRAASSQDEKSANGNFTISITYKDQRNEELGTVTFHNTTGKILSVQSNPDTIKKSGLRTLNPVHNAKSILQLAKQKGIKLFGDQRSGITARNSSNTRQVVLPHQNDTLPTTVASLAAAQLIGQEFLSEHLPSSKQLYNSPNGAVELNKSTKFELIESFKDRFNVSTDQEIKLELINSNAFDAFVFIFTTEERRDILRVPFRKVTNTIVKDLAFFEPSLLEQKLNSR